MNGKSSEHVQFWREIRQHGLEKQLKTLMQPNLLRAALTLGTDWLLITAAYLVCVTISWWFLPITILIVGSRQAALNNLLHEASHKNLARDAGINNVLGEWFCALPSLTTLGRYRTPHMAHHRLLGDPNGDPDYLPLIAGQRWMRRWFSMVMNHRRFVETILGTIRAMGSADRCRVVCWWGGTLAFLACFAGVSNAIAFAALWLSSRVLVYYPLSTFREMADHYGLDPSSWLGYTRNVEGHWLIAVIVHPHNDGYHLIHHLIPTIPFHRTKEAHNLLLQLPLYAKLHNCDSYFTGHHPLVKCLDGTCGS